MLLLFQIKKSLISYTIPDTITMIYNNAFYKSANLIYISISNNIKYIYNNSLQETSLQSITVSYTNNNYSSIDGVLFDKNQTTLMQYPNGNITQSYSIPNGIISIIEYGFKNVINISKLTIPSSFSSIGNGACNTMTKLSQVIFLGDAINLGTTNGIYIINNKIRFNGGTTSVQNDDTNVFSYGKLTFSYPSGVNKWTNPYYSFNQTPVVEQLDVSLVGISDSYVINASNVLWQLQSNGKFKYITRIPGKAGGLVKTNSVIVSDTLNGNIYYINNYGNLSILLRGYYGIGSITLDKSDNMYFVKLNENRKSNIYLKYKNIYKTTLLLSNLGKNIMIFNLIDTLIVVNMDTNIISVYTISLYNLIFKYDINVSQYGSITSVITNNNKLYILMNKNSIYILYNNNLLKNKQLNNNYNGIAYVNNILYGITSNGVNLYATII